MENMIVHGSSLIRRTLASCLVLSVMFSLFQSPEPGLAAPSSVFFSQTGHTLSDQFLTYWRENGGLSIYGFPISEPFDQGGFKVQYFERARFELHPEFAGTPFEVELGLLGTLFAQDLTQGDAFRPQSALPDWQDTASRDYFAATGHYLSYGFKTYWEKNGGLAVFGYPISEETSENGRTVQYFERARFEYWPEHQGTPYEVQLGLLGDWAAKLDQVDTASIDRPDGIPDYSAALFSGPRSLHIPVLMYHQIAPSADRYVTPLWKFEQEMDWVQSRGYHTVSLQQLYDYMFNGGSLPSNPIVISFDDSTAGHWDAAAALDARGMKGVFFVVTGHSQLSQDQLRSMSQRGHDVESHSVSHPYFTQQSDDSLSYQLNQSRATLESILGQQVNFIAYPYGDYNGRVIDATASAGYTGGIAAWGGEDWTTAKRWNEPRVEISGLLSLDQFAALVQQ